MHFTNKTPTVVSEVRTFVLGQRQYCVSDREWKFRLNGFGYDLRETDSGTVLTTLPAGVEICTIDI
ncbi:hypothetical protein OAH97_01965 [Octadecabacter sp.]|nr:hypothetical protein [Octadecabacter sp.]